MRQTIAVILTVFNRREVTLRGLRSLKQAMAFRQVYDNGKEYVFDIYMTDDGCTDGTGVAVQQQFPDVKIIQGDGNLFWSRGMRLAWQAAIGSGVDYDYYIWYNDDVELYEDAVETLLGDSERNKDAIVSGAFCNHNGSVSYGGWINDKLVAPNGSPQEIELMNGNLVLIPREAYRRLELIDSRYHHGEGDFDYALRARKAGIPVCLTHKYVGRANRHDSFIPKYCSSDYSILERWRFLHAPYLSVHDHFKFNALYNGYGTALKSLVICYMGMLFPSLYKRIKSKRRE